MAKVSVWLTSYNHGSLLKKSIDSVLAQTYQDYELILIDDASTDGSQDLIRDYAKKDSRIRTILRSENIGTSAPQPYLDTLNGEYLAILHGDDYWLPEKLEKQVKVMDERPEVSVCFTAVNLVNELDEPDRIHKNPFLRELLPKGKLLRLFFDQGNALCHPSSMMRISAYRNYGLDLEGYNGLADYYKWLILAVESEICLIPEPLTCFRNYISEKNMSGNRPEVIRRAMLEELFICREFFKIPDRKLLLEVFPEAQNYITDGKIHIPFIVAQMMLNSSRSHIRLAGLEKLMELRRDKTERETIEKLYQYDNKAFDRDEQRYDLFGSWPREQFMDCGLYLNYGEGYREENVIRQKCFIPTSEVVQVSFELPEEKPGEILQSMRFDPDEGVLRRIRMESVQWEDQSSISYRSVNAERQMDGTDVFYTTDPQYILEAKEGHSAVCIRMHAESIPMEEVLTVLAQLRTDSKKNDKQRKEESPRFSLFRHKTSRN